EEQFYLVVPVALLLLFRMDGQRFGFRTAAIAAGAGILSLVGAVLWTSTQGANAAFYLTHLRMWEFIAGGFICAPLVAASQRLPRLLLEALGLAGLAFIIAAVGGLVRGPADPSLRAAL